MKFQQSCKESAKLQRALVLYARHLSKGKFQGWIYDGRGEGGRGGGGRGVVNPWGGEEGEQKLIQSW